MCIESRLTFLFSRNVFFFFFQNDDTTLLCERTPDDSVLLKEVFPAKMRMQIDRERRCPERKRNLRHKKIRNVTTSTLTEAINNVETSKLLQYDNNVV